MPGLGGQAKVKTNSCALLNLNAMAIAVVHALVQERRPDVLQAEVPCICVHQDRQAHDGPGTYAHSLTSGDFCVTSGGCVAVCGRSLSI